MPKHLDKLVEAARRVKLSRRDQEEQRRSFAFGNANIENQRVTRETVDREAEALEQRR
jgi:hypothetical protein